MGLDEKDLSIEIMNIFIEKYSIGIIDYKDYIQVGESDDEIIYYYRIEDLELD